MTVRLFRCIAGLALVIGLLGAASLVSADNGNNGTVQACKTATGVTVGACVSYGPSDGESVAYAPGLCDQLAAIVGGYGFSAELSDQATGQDLGTVGPMNTKGQCVGTLGQALKGESAFVYPFFA